LRLLWVVLYLTIFFIGRAEQNSAQSTRSFACALSWARTGYRWAFIATYWLTWRGWFAQCRQLLAQIKGNCKYTFCFSLFLLCDSLLLVGVIFILPSIPGRNRNIVAKAGEITASDRSKICLLPHSVSQSAF
jgi:hypothetical protein